MRPYITEDIIRHSVALTGYRPFKMPFGNDLNHPGAIRLRANLKTEFDNLVNAGCFRFVTGGALGCDLMAAEVILELIEEYADEKKLIHQLCLPCYNHDAKWNDQDRRRLEKIIEKSTTSYVSDRPYFNGCMQIRNEYMVNTCLRLIAVYDGQKGGTHNTVEYAKRMNRHVIIINPVLFTRTELIQTSGDIDLMINKF